MDDGFLQFFGLTGQWGAQGSETEEQEARAVCINLGYGAVP